MLSDPANARNGNLIAAAGMTIAILGTIFYIKMMKESAYTIMAGYSVAF